MADGQLGLELSAFAAPAASEVSEATNVSFADRKQSRWKRPSPSTRLSDKVSDSAITMTAPPFTLRSAYEKVKTAQALWNTRDASRVALAYTPDSTWRNRSTFVRGRGEIEAFLRDKWTREEDYVLRKELFAFNENRIAVQFYYEYRLQGTQSWNRCYGLEHWVFAPDGKMQTRQMSGNELAIAESERWFKDGVDPDSVTIPDGHGSFN